jgi:hypothetical protein
MRFKSDKQRKAVMAKIRSLQDKQGRYLLDHSHGSTFSANAGDYWDMKPKQKFVGMTLMKDDRVVKEEPSKADLVDETYISQDIHRLENKLRPTLKKTEMKAHSVEGKEFDEKGRFIVRGEVSDTWTFEGLANIYGEKVMSWDDFVKNPSAVKKLRGKVFVIDKDSGTIRIHGKPLNKERWW